MMSNDTSQINITPLNLSEKDRAIVKNIKAWVLNAKFEPRHEGEFHLCVDAQLSEKWQLLKVMDSIRKV